MSPRTPLLRPDRYFDDREPDITRGIAVAVLVTLTAVALIAGIGFVFTEKIDGTVMIDNPDRPPEGFCETGGTSLPDGFGDSGFNCSAPAEVERNIDSLITGSLGEFYGVMLIGVPIMLLVVAAGLHLATAAVGGEGSFGATATVAVWGFAPTLVTTLLGLVALWLVMDPVTVATDVEPDILQQTLLESLGPWLPIASVLNIGSLLWGAVIWTFGLQAGRDVSRAQAGAIAIVVTGILILVAAP
jgi:hypothetical protein